VEKNPTQSDKLVEQLALLLQDHAPDQEQFEAYQEPDEIRRPTINPVTNIISSCHLNFFISLR
ncbi:MAG: hypothetical protein SVT56_11320, partial [Chloroflexota bacterium]|nr:hypothetical protein [Chloroflexota bacterium]